MKPKRFWGGFVNGKLDVTEVDTGWGGYGTGSTAKIAALFHTRKEARARYEDVRPVIVPIDEPKN